MVFTDTASTLTSNNNKSRSLVDTSMYSLSSTKPCDNVKLLWMMSEVE